MRAALQLRQASFARRAIQHVPNQLTRPQLRRVALEALNVLTWQPQKNDAQRRQVTPPRRHSSWRIVYSLFSACPHSCRKTVACGVVGWQTMPTFIGVPAVVLNGSEGHECDVLVPLDTEVGTPGAVVAEVDSHQLRASGLIGPPEWPHLALQTRRAIVDGNQYKYSRLLVAAGGLECTCRRLDRHVADHSPKGTKWQLCDVLVDSGTAPVQLKFFLKALQTHIFPLDCALRLYSVTPVEDGGRVGAPWGLRLCWCRCSC